MAYGTVKVDNITFDNGGSDQNVTVSGLYRATTSGVTVTGTISGAVLVGTTTVSGATVTGNVVQGTTVQGVSGTFTSLTGTTTTGTTANFASGVFTTRVSGTIITGDTGQFTSGTFVSLTGTTITGTTINAVTVSSTTGTFTSLTGTTITGTTINGVTVAATTGSFTSLTGTTTSGTTANFVSGVFTTQVSGTTVTGTTSNFTSGNFATLSGATATFTSGIIASGTAAAPSLAILADLDTGLFSPGANQVAVATNGAGRLFINSTGDIQVGAASTVNAALLSATADPASKNLYLAFNGTTTGADFLMGGISANANGTNIGTVDIYRGSSDNHGYISLRTKNGTTLGERLRITDAGLVGIGTSAATDKLHLHEASSSACYLHITNDTTGSAATNGVIVGLDSSEQFYIYSYENNSMIFGTNNAERVRLDASGRLLIGASADSGGALFQVNGDRIRVGTAKTPATSGATGTTGEIAWDADYIYVCTATNTWKRSAIATW
jgi:hypothetical protein